MTLDDALAPLPLDSPYRSIITKLMSPESEIRRQGTDEIIKNKLSSKPSARKPRYFEHVDEHEHRFAEHEHEESPRMIEKIRHGLPL